MHAFLVFVLWGFSPFSPLNHEGCRGCLTQHSNECHHLSVAVDRVAPHDVAPHNAPTSRQASAGVVSQQQHSGRAPLHLPVGALWCCHQKHHFGFHNNPEKGHRNWADFLTLHMHLPSSWGKIQPQCWCYHQCPRPVLVPTFLRCPLFDSMTAGCAQCPQSLLCQADLGTFRLSFRPAVPELGCCSCDRDAPGNVLLANCYLSQPSCRQG